MSKCRVMVAGLTGSQYAVNPYVVQFGDKLQGCARSRVGVRAANAWAVAKRAGCADRHVVFCVNQLGGVGRHRTQASGPGNRAGVSQAAKEVCRKSQESVSKYGFRNAPTRYRRLQPYQGAYGGSSR